MTVMTGDARRALTRLLNAFENHGDGDSDYEDDDSDFEDDEETDEDDDDDFIEVDD